MMYRSGWGMKHNQEKVLAIRITREGFDTILTHALTGCNLIDSNIIVNLCHFDLINSICLFCMFELLFLLIIFAISIITIIIHYR